MIKRIHARELARTHTRMRVRAVVDTAASFDVGALSLHPGWAPG